MAGETTATVGTHLIPEEVISREMLREGQDPFIYEQICYLKDLGTDKQYSEPLQAHRSVATAHTEAAETTSVAMSFSNATAAPAMFDANGTLTDELEGATDLPIQLALMHDQMNACGLKVDTDVVGMSASATTDTGVDTQALTNAKFIEYLTEFRAQAGRFGNDALILGHAAKGALVKDLGASAAAIFGSNGVGAEARGVMANDVRIPRYLDCDIYVNERVPANGAGLGNMFVKTGGADSAALVLAFKRPRLPFFQGIIGVGQEQFMGPGTFKVYARTWHAVAIRDQERILEVITA